MGPPAVDHTADFRLLAAPLSARRYGMGLDNDRLAYFKLLPAFGRILTLTLFHKL